VKNTFKLGAVLLAAAAACGGNDNSGPLGNVDSLVILQRMARNDMGDIFQYTSYIPGARLVKLSPPTASGKLTTLCCDQAGSEFADVDISSYDISFDAKSIVFAAKLKASERYGLFVLTLADNTVTQIASDPMKDYVSPVYLPGDKIFFMTNNVVEPGAPQHMDEYERGVTSQVGMMNLDGTGEELGPRNLSHRSNPSLASDGRIIFTNWDHLGPENAGHLMFMNSDLTGLREAFGKEGSSPANSTLAAREISPGRFVAISTSRDRTLQSGALYDIRLGTVSGGGDEVRADSAMSEANATYVNMTPDVPIDREPSADTIGRYHDAFPLNAKDKPDLLVAWADGPVESSVLSAAGLNANFGVYLYDPVTLQRHPILDDPNYWDIYARPLQARTAPPSTGSQIDSTLASGQALVGSMNVYQSTLHSFTTGEIYGVRLMEGFSSEEGFSRMFGTTMFEGHANLGVARVASDGSWLAKVPANVPLHLQAVDTFGMSIFNEPVWFSARSGESRVCGGCHEDRATSTIINPGITQAAAIGPNDAMSLIPRNNRMNATPVAPTDIVGVGWDVVLQPMFTAKCAGCHDGTPSAANPTYTITDPMTNVTTQWTFDLTGRPVQVADRDGTLYTYSASYLSMAGPDMEAIERNNLVVGGVYPCKDSSGNPSLQCLNPEDARNSYAVKLVNPTVLFPTACDATTTTGCQRAFPGTNHKGVDLTPTEYYALILAADMGVNFFARENNPHMAGY
jgi:hypothetical protein